MTLCAVKRGFFNLRDCGTAATGACSACSRPMCQQHTVQAGNALLCLDCYARRTEGVATQQAYDRRWAYARRHNYYSSGSYSPVYWGSSYDHYYDDYDVRSFDREETEPDFAEEQSGADFFDS